MMPDSFFKVTGPEGFLEGAFIYDPDSYTVTFIPNEDLVPDTRYGVLVAGQVALNGQVQQSAYQWNFSTITPTSVSIVSFGQPDQGQNWWWSSWPWFMGIISVLSLTGFLLVWRRRQFATQTNEMTPS